MKRRIFAVIAAVLMLTTLGSCKKESGRPFDYDLSKYVKLGKYVGIEYKYSVAEVTDEAVTAFVNGELSGKGYGETKEIKDRAVKTGDVVNIDFVGKKDGVAFEGGTSKGYDLTIGSKTFIDGFEDGVIGMKPGETKDLNLKFPENYGNEELNGAAVVFTVTANHIKETVYPELTDKIVTELSDYKTVDEYMKYAKDTVATNNKTAADNAKETEIWSKIVDAVEVKSLPQDEIDTYKKLLIEQYDQIAQQQYGCSYEDFLKNYMNQTLEDVDEDLVKQAEGAVKEYMTIVAIARDQDIDISEQEYNELVEKYTKSNGYSNKEDFLKAIDESQFYLSLLVEKVMDFVVENAVETK